MCVAMPGTVLSVGEGSAVVDFSGNTVSARAGLVDVKPGDRVLVHAGCILQKISMSEMEEFASMMEELKSF